MTKKYTNIFQLLVKIEKAKFWSEIKTNDILWYTAFLYRDYYFEETIAFLTLEKKLNKKEVCTMYGVAQKIVSSLIQRDCDFRVHVGSLSSSS